MSNPIERVALMMLLNRGDMLLYVDLKFPDAYTGEDIITSANTIASSVLVKFAVILITLPFVINIIHNLYHSFLVYISD